MAVPNVCVGGRGGATPGIQNVTQEWRSSSAKGDFARMSQARAPVWDSTRFSLVFAGFAGFAGSGTGGRLAGPFPRAPGVRMT